MPTPPSTAVQRQGPYSPRRIVTTRILLTRLVPHEIADLIVDQAEFWPSAKISFEGEPGRPFSVLASGYGSGSLDARRCVLLTEEIASWLHMMPVFRLRRVVFQTMSHDQGWTTDPIWAPGDYGGARTWFEVTIVSGFDRPDLAPNSKEMHDAITHELGKTPKDRSSALTTRKHVVGNGEPHSDVWLVQRNRRANGQDKHHTVMWTSSEIAGVYNYGDDADEVNMLGCGKGRGFLECVQPGDRIALMARAEGDAWQNFITMASVEVFYAI